jgi:succinate dehydrogenase / fumarate reductase flavoprotein subunit
MGKGVQGKQQVYLDITHLHESRGGPYTRNIINDKLEGVLEIYEKFMLEDPIELPMRIYPAVHYTMGGLWVGYEKGHDTAIDDTSPKNQMTNVPGLFAAGECDYQYHGANRLGANALLSCLYGGEIAAQGIQAYLKEEEAGGGIAADEARREAQAEYDELKSNRGSENPYRLAAELADLMWNNCGIWRTQKDLLAARDALQGLGERARQCRLIDASGWTNQAVPFTRALGHMVEMSKAIVGGAIVRDESRGAHFKMDTPDRDDSLWLRSTMATWTPEGPSFDFESVETPYIAPRARKYRINQNKIVETIMGKEALAGVG